MQTKSQSLSLDMSSKKKKQKVQHIPQTLQDSIPYVRVAEENGIFETKTGEYSKSYYFPEINFRTLNNDGQLKIAQAYSTFVSAFPQDTTIEITIYNKNVDIMKFQDDIMLKMKNDGLDIYRDEYNNMLLDKLSGAKNNLETVKLLTIGIKANDLQEAFDKFIQIDGIVSENMALVTKRDTRALTTIERLDLLNTIYNHDTAVSLRQKKSIQGVQVEAFSLENCRAQGITTKDVIAPSGMLVKNHDIEVGSSFTRSYYISNYPSWIKSTLLTELASLPANMLVSVYFDAIPQDEAIKMIKRQGTNISANLLEIQKKAAKSGFDPSLVSPDLQVAKEESSELMNEMTKDNGMLFTGNIVITIFASSLDELQRLEELLKAITIKSLVFLKPLNFQQEEGFNSSLPLANNQLKIQRLMTNNTISSINPFSVREVHQKTGMYYGLNAASRNMILYDRTTDLEQRQGRIERQGNMFPEVEVYRYVTEQTFDAYLYQLVESKQKFISQIMTSKSPVRSAEDVDEVALSFAEVKMLATGDERFKEKMDLDMQVSKLKVLKQSYLNQHYELEDRVLQHFPKEIKQLEQLISAYGCDVPLLEQHKPKGEDRFCPMTLQGVTYTEKADAGKMLLAICKEYPLTQPKEIGSYRGFQMEIYYDTVNTHYCLNLCGKTKHKVNLGEDALGNLTRIENELARIPDKLEAAKTRRTEILSQIENAKEELAKPFDFEDELKEKTERLNALNIELNLDQKDPAVLDAEPEETNELPERKAADRER